MADEDEVHAGPQMRKHARAASALNQAGIGLDLDSTSDMRLKWIRRCSPHIVLDKTLGEVQETLCFTIVSASIG